MKPLFGTLVLMSLLFVCMSITNQKRTRIVFFGDSITEAGVKPGGYITRMNEALQKRGTAGNYELIGAGISGNKVYDLLVRMEQDVVARSPDVVVVWIGVNDVWHKSSSGTGTDADKFEFFYTSIIKKLQAKKIKVLLATPAAIGERTDHSNQQDGDLNNYSNIIRRLATDNKCGLIDLRSAFLSYNLKHNTSTRESGILTTDRVHLNEAGNSLVAEKMMDALTQK